MTSFIGYDDVLDTRRHTHTTTSCVYYGLLIYTALVRANVCPGLMTAIIRRRARLRQIMREKEKISYIAVTAISRLLIYLY